MAQTLSASASVSNTSRGTFSGSRAFTVSATGNNAATETLSIATSEAEWTIPASIGNAGLMTIKNTDGTNYVQVGFATTVYSLRLLAGQTALLPLEPATASIFLKANSAACVVEIGVYEA